MTQRRPVALTLPAVSKSRIGLFAGFLFTLLLAFMPAGAQGADDAVAPARVVAAESRLSVEGGSTVRSWACETATFEGALRVRAQALPIRLATLANASSLVDMRIPVGSLDCGNTTMNAHMWRALERDSHPRIRFVLQRYTIDEQGADEGTATLFGRLTIAGVERPVRVSGNVKVLGDGRVRLTGETGVAMTDYGIDPPRLMMGSLRVHDDVTVKFDLVVEANHPSS